MSVLVYIQEEETFENVNQVLFLTRLNRPTSTATLIAIEGFSEKICDRFGEEIVNFVSQFCKEKDLSMDKMASLKVLLDFVLFVLFVCVVL